MNLSVRFVNGLLRIWGRLQAVSMATRLGAGEVASIVSGLVVILVECATSLLGSSDGANALVIVVGALAVIIPIAREIAQFVSTATNYNVRRSEAYHKDVQSRLSLTRAYEQNGYAIKEFVDGGKTELYVASRRVDKMLASIRVDAELKDAIPLELRKGKFRIPEEVRPVVFDVLRRMFSKHKGKRLTNGKLVRMCGDLLPNDEGRGAIPLQLVRYFDGQCTHEIVYKRAAYEGSLSGYFKGETLLMREDGALLELWESRCANFIGSSTMAITVDNCLVIGKQGAGSMANVGRLAPSGSGSVSYADIACVRQTGCLTLHRLIAYAAERELREECGLPDNAPMTTQVVGYVRLLERGGKPDFFCVTRLDMTSDEVARCFQSQLKITERDSLSAHVEFEPIVNGSPAETLASFIENKKAHAAGKNAVSIQMHILVENMRGIESATMPQGFEGDE